MPGLTYGREAEDLATTLAHFTDPHLSLAGVRLTELFGKRLIGWLSWTLRRRRSYRPEALRALVADMRATAPDALMVLTGDVVNISTRAEFAAARAWLEGLARPEALALVPGNHDHYVAGAVRAGLPLLAPWMGGDAAASALPEFPIVRYVRNVAVIGLNSSYPAPWREASGRLGEAQLQRLEALLRDSAGKGLCRVVLVHHPPLPSLCEKPRKALKDAAALESVLKRAGAELVLFGHTHRWAHAAAETGDGVVHALSVPSASMKVGGRRPPAGWQHISIRREQGRWLFRVERRELTNGGDLRPRETLALASDSLAT